MKKIYTLLLLFFSTALFSQHFEKQWKEVILYELDGKTTAASKTVDKIYRHAKRKGNDAEIVKCFFYQSKFLMVFEEEAQQKIIGNLKAEIKNAKGVNGQVLSYIYAVMLSQYCNRNMQTIAEHTPTNSSATEFLTWGLTDFEQEIEKALQNMLLDESRLRAVTVNDYKQIFDISPYTDAKKTSLYDFLLDKVLEYNKSSVFGGLYKNAEDRAAVLGFFFSEPSVFTSYDTTTLSDKKLIRLIRLMQHNESYYLKHNTEKCNWAYYERINYGKQLASDWQPYILSLSWLENTTKSDYLKQQVRAERATYYFSITKKGKENHYKQCLVLIDSILKSKANLNAMADAEALKTEILQKKLSITTKRICYPNENLRAFVKFKNVDSVKISYYRLPLSYTHLLYNYAAGHKEKDSLVLDYISRHKPVTVFTRNLPQTNDFSEHTTEVLLEKFDTGNYLVFMQTNENPEGKQLSFSYENITATRFNYLKDEDKQNDIFNVMDRKSGRPIENVLVKNVLTSVITNSSGRAAFAKKIWVQGIQTRSDLYFIQQNDTLLDSYDQRFLYTQHDNGTESFEAKSMVYFDRAIYRPGQKVFFKVIMIQKKNGEKSIVPFLTVHVNIADDSGNDLKKYDIQTNEFGSFSGEFEIPKNVLTGEFTLSLEEPENYEADKKYYDIEQEEHLFWDYVDYNDYQDFTFQVEEYKRPTFAVSFDTVKENYKLGDLVKVTGNAKTLSGSNLTNAKVSYTVSKMTTTTNSKYDVRKNFINTTTHTDNKGQFSITFLAVNDSIVNDSINHIDYTVEMNVTDQSGETHTASKRLTVGKHTLKINTILSQNLLLEDKNQLTIKATTLNDYPIDTNGEISIYALKRKHFLINRLTSMPEMQTLSRNEFETLFPFEAYLEEDFAITEVLIRKIKFDTKISKTVALGDMKLWEPGAYKVVVTALDNNKNTISATDSFTANSKNKKASTSELFTFNDISNPKAGYFEIEFKSLIPDLFIASRFYEENKLVIQQGVQLKNGRGTVKIDKKSTYKTPVNFHFSAFWENQYVNSNHTISKEKLEAKLPIEVISLRNKIEPGSIEKWAFRIKDNQQEAEFLASMYDTSLDQFKTDDWKNPIFYNHNYPDFPDYYMHNINYLTFDLPLPTINYYNKYMRKPEINWFGFDFSNPKSRHATKKYIDRVKHVANIPFNAKVISGIVSDESGPLPGANIVVKGTTRGVQSNLDGYFEIEATYDETLVFSFIGMGDQFRKADSKVINIKLTNSAKLEEVVVQGYRSVARKATTSSSVNYYTLDEEDKALAFSALQGQLAGLSINTNQGQPGGKPSVVIRGIGPINESTEPLYIIDGIPSNRDVMLKLNSDDISSVMVLKDAAATAEYGSRGANGVIIVMTNSGIAELTQVKTRSNFNETAFFYPELVTDKQGQITFSFNTPESLTKWKLRLFAHNKKAETGYFHADVISQKDIMIIPNMPRFVREKDRITISAKVMNMTNESKSGLAMLMLYDATNGKSIDSLAINSKSFNCKPKESTAVSWNIVIPQSLQGLHYKIVAKSGDFSDGEENIIPVLTNKILITESIPLWVKGNSKKEFNFENLKNSKAGTLQSHSLTLEYTTNPIWPVLLSLPYLLEYPHECAEQTFARYYANCIAAEIIGKNSGISALFESWRINGKPQSRLEMNKELKSVILAESPWLLDSQSDQEKDKTLALLLDPENLQKQNEAIFQKLVDKMLPSGGFAWFDGGSENTFISQHILSGIGHLSKMFPKDEGKYDLITAKGIPNMDMQFIARNKTGLTSTIDMHYLYTRSFFTKKHPLTKATDTLIRRKINNLKKDWLTLTLYEKGILALVMNRFDQKELAKKIISHLKESAVSNQDYGMYWAENQSGYYWNHAPIETQAVLIEAFAEVDNDLESIEAMKVWLIKNKSIQNWPTTKATTEAIYALLFQGLDWTTVKDNTKIKIGTENLLDTKLKTKQQEADTGYYKANWKKEEITAEMSSVSIKNNTTIPGYGGIYWQYFQNLEDITPNLQNSLSVTKKLFKKVATTNGNLLLALDGETLNVGDLLTVRLVVQSQQNLEFVHLKDLRASCFEPVDVLSNYEWRQDTGYYKSTKDAATHLFFDSLKRGTYVFEYDVRINNAGEFNDGVTTIQSMYAPEYTAYGTSVKVYAK